MIFIITIGLYPKLWDYWLPDNPGSIEKLNHEPWAFFLKTYVVQGEDGINRVAYGKV